MQDATGLELCGHVLSMLSDVWCQGSISFLRRVLPMMALLTRVDSKGLRKLGWARPIFSIGTYWTCQHLLNRVRVDGLWPRLFHPRRELRPTWTTPSASLLVSLYPEDIIHGDVETPIHSFLHLVCCIFFRCIHRTRNRRHCRVWTTINTLITIYNMWKISKHFTRLYFKSIKDRNNSLVFWGEPGGCCECGPPRNSLCRWGWWAKRQRDCAGGTDFMHIGQHESCRRCTNDNNKWIFSLFAAFETSNMMNSRIHTLWHTPLRVGQNEGMKRMYQGRDFGSDTFGVAIVDTGTWCCLYSCIDKCTEAYHIELEEFWCNDM